MFYSNFLLDLILGIRKNSIPYMDESDIMRFWDKVSFKDHWIWTSNVNKMSGYGMFKLKDKNFYAHRIAYYLINHIQPPLFHDLDHVCKVRECVNPDHLELVTHSVNCMRGLKGEKPMFCGKGLHKLEGYNRMVTEIRENGTEKVSCRECDKLRSRIRYNKPNSYGKRRNNFPERIDYMEKYRNDNRDKNIEYQRNYKKIV